MLMLGVVCGISGVGRERLPGQFGVRSALAVFWGCQIWGYVGSGQKLLWR